MSNKDFRIYAHEVEDPLLLTGEDGVSYVVTSECEDDGRSILLLYKFDNREDAEIMACNGNLYEVIKDQDRRSRTIS